MSRRVVFIFLVVSAAQLAGTVLAQNPSDDVPRRLAAYEMDAAANRAKPEELAAIAGLLLKRLAASQDAGVLIQACSSRYAQEPECTNRLWAIAKRQEAAMAHRLSAASALLARKDPQASAFLLNLAAAADPVRLAPLAFLLKDLPADKAVPLLIPLVKSADPSSEIAGCRALSGFDATKGREAIAEYLRTAPRGTDAWFACTIAAGRLGDADAGRTTGFITPYLKGEDLLNAGDVLLAGDRDRAVGLYLQATREARGLTRLEAADRLVDLNPEAARQLCELAIESGDMQIIAAALELHRHLKLEPSARIRSFLLASDPLVQLRASEVILSAEARRKGTER